MLASLAGLCFILALTPQDPSRQMPSLIEEYRADRGALSRFYSVEHSETRRSRLRDFYSGWLGRLSKLDFDRLDHSQQIDYILLRNDLERQLRQLEIDQKELAEVESFLPFRDTITRLEEARRRLDPMDSEKTAATINALATAVQDAQKKAEGAKPPRHIAMRAASAVGSLRGTLRSWNTFYNGYDPLFTWWVAEPYKKADSALLAYATFLREKVAGIRQDDTRTIVGNPIGREALIAQLQFELIPYTPEELVKIAEREFAWCETEMIRASRDLGYGDDWKKALEHVKNKHVKPGEQPQLIKDLAIEAIDFLEKNDLVSIPPLAKETWRMEMMTPERQLTSPFFLGGEQITVSFPTNTMDHEDKLMSLRGNNIHFSRATVHHELIPGHHLQGFMNARHKTHRREFSTPFWGEGWALYWEMLLWDLGFPKTPEDRVGFLFWRMHRCARIMFSLGFHLGTMSPQECVDLLVEKVGHERANAEAEVRRSFGGQYGPLYQAAYMLGGLQFRALHRELVQGRKMTNRQFHDAILQENSMPVELVRAILTKQKLTRDFQSSWRF